MNNNQNELDKQSIDNANRFSEIYLAIHDITELHKYAALNVTMSTPYDLTELLSKAKHAVKVIMDAYLPDVFDNYLNKDGLIHEFFSWSICRNWSAFPNRKSKLHVQHVLKEISSEEYIIKFRELTNDMLKEVEYVIEKMNEYLTPTSNG